MAITALFLSVLCAAWLIAGDISGWLYLACYVLAVLPGMPLGWLLFGRRHAGGWVAGALMGYVIACLIAWAADSADAYFAAAAVIGWLGFTFTTFTLTDWRSRGPLVDLGSWPASATRALVAVLVIASTLSTIPLRRVGQIDGQGDRQYRAYFIADFVWHTALTAELTKGTMPPRNPYLAPDPIHYYWTYFLVPAALARGGPAPLRNVEECLKLNALATGLLFVSASFVLAHATSRRAAAAGIATTLALVATSAEGLYEVVRTWSHSVPWSALRGVNIDALSAWYFQGHRIDGLQRCLWYVPQHSTAYGLGLIALTAAAAAGAEAPLAAVVIVGLALAGSVMMNPFVGGLFAAAWGIAIAVHALRTPEPFRRIGRHAIAIVPVLAAIAWCASNRMVDGAGGMLMFGWAPASRHSPIWNLTLSMGPALAPTVLLFLLRPRHIAWSRMLPAACLCLIALIVMHTVWLSVDEPWAPFRAGQMLLAALPAMTGCLIAGVANQRRLRPLAGAVIVAAFVSGFPTTAIDAFNAQDVENRDPGPGFYWTLRLSPDEQAAMNFIRTSTPRNSIVQMEPAVRDRQLSAHGWGEHWSLVPSFGQRRMAAGLPISLMRTAKYGERSAEVREIFETPDATRAWELGHQFRIDYIYIDARDRAVYPGAAKFDEAHERFEAVFRSGEAAVYKLK